MSQLMSTMGDIKRQIGIIIPSNIENNPRREGREHVNEIVLRLVTTAVEPEKDTIKDSVIAKIPFLSRLEEKQRYLLEDVLVKAHNFIIPADFVFLEFEEDREMTILLGEKNKFNERDKQKKVEWHDRQMTNIERTRESSLCEFMVLSDESDKKIGMHRNVDIPKYEKMHQLPESGSLLSPVSDITMQKSRGTIASSEQSMKPSRNIICDTLYTQYTKLQAKQIKELNKR
ncbi:hypothetical protein Gohar_004369 [Gossypium harknessii]|uniref:Uncharacterized protein n=1 Tax=Gossypium harknessii TaxID=34285 RepID=A0A7J9H4Y5_9ROSI|nr:hypothetical protein [Gossypium harknessii]